jgi:hypothetical protein
MTAEGIPALTEKRAEKGFGPLVACLYATLAVPGLFILSGVFALGGRSSQAGFAIVAIGLGLLSLGLLAFFAVAIVRSFRCALALSRRGDAGAFHRKVLRLKLVLIPFFALNFALNAVIWMILTGASRGLFIFLLPIPIGVCFCFLLATSLPALFLIGLLRRQGRIGSAGFVVHVILQLIFVLDILGVLLLGRKAHSPNLP